MKVAYSFVVLRYVHDVMSGEFVNVGVAVYSPEQKFIGAQCNTRYTRLSKMFLNVDGDYFRGLMRYIEAHFEEMGDRLKKELPFNAVPINITEIAKKVLPPDDSSLQWSPAGGGYTENPAKTLEELFVRFVEQYEDKKDLPRKSDDDVWKTFKTQLETKRVLARLQPKRIVSKDYEYEFARSWKNEQWHVYEPVSFDLLESDSIQDKANRWLGRITTLRQSSDKFKVHFLLGEPSVNKMRPAFLKAENILNSIPVEKELIHEQDAAQFSGKLAKEIASHGGDIVD